MITSFVELPSGVIQRISPVSASRTILGPFV